MALPNAKATNANGELKLISDCEILIPGTGTLNGTQSGQILFTSLPELTDQKGATYNDEPVIGRALPIKTFQQGENRTISVTVNFYIIKPGDETLNLRILRAIQSAVYPREGANGMPYFPPPVCKIKCGKLLAGGQTSGYLCVIMKDYNVKFPTDVPFHQDNYCPYKMEISMSFDTVYPSSLLPNQEQIILDL